jgi:hypothetical protein
MKSWFSIGKNGWDFKVVFLLARPVLVGVGLDSGSSGIMVFDTNQN